MLRAASRQADPAECHQKHAAASPRPGSAGNQRTPPAASPRPGSAGNPRTYRLATDATALAGVHPPSQREEHRIDWVPSLGTSGLASPAIGPVGFQQKRELASLQLARGGSPQKPWEASPPSGWALADPSPPAASAEFAAGSSEPLPPVALRPTVAVSCHASPTVEGHQTGQAATHRMLAQEVLLPGLP